MDVWPFRKGQSRTPIARRSTQPDDHRTSDAAPVRCTSPVWHDSSTAWMNRNFSSSASSSSTVRACSSSELARHPAFQLSPFSPDGSLRQALDTRSCGEPRYAGPAFLHAPFTPLDAAALARGVFIGLPIPGTFEGEGGLLATRPEQGFEAPCPDKWISAVSHNDVPQGFEAPLEAGSCSKDTYPECSAAVMTYLEGPLAVDFDFMFVDEERVL